MPARSGRRELLVFLEGAVTEEAYVNAWRRENRHVNVEIDPFHGPPMALVDRAIGAKARNEKDARRGRGRAHDEVWCVFDVDEHPHLPDAIRRARDHGIGVAVSNPCIELWFILHFADQTAHIGRREAQRRAEDHLGCRKVLSAAALDRLVAAYPDAKARARSLDEKHHGDGTPAPGNPGSGVWRLVDSIAT